MENAKRENLNGILKRLVSDWDGQFTFEAYVGDRYGGGQTAYEALCAAIGKPEANTLLADTSMSPWRWNDARRCDVALLLDSDCEIMATLCKH